MPSPGPFYGGNTPPAPQGQSFVNWLQVPQIVQQLASMFNPTHPTGLLNIASMFAGGKDMPEEMQGWTAPYTSGTLQKAGVAHLQPQSAEGQPWDILDNIQRSQVIKLMQAHPELPKLTPAGRTAYLDALRKVHDSMFGGETWLSPGNQIPPRP